MGILRKKEIPASCSATNIAYLHKNILTAALLQNKLDQKQPSRPATALQNIQLRQPHHVTATAAFLWFSSAQIQLPATMPKHQIRRNTQTS